MSYAVCLPTAGTGSRLGNKTKYINKSLLTIANKPIISHLIKKFPEECEFIIPLGFKGNLVRQFLEIAYPKKNFRFVNVEPFEGKGSGLSHTLKSCKKFLLKPFVFMSCDTFVEESIPPPLENWMAYDFKEECSSYRTINLNNQIVIEICEKGKTFTKNHFPYIGLAGIKDYEYFWEGMDKVNENQIEMGEVCGLRNIINKKIKGIKMTWRDTGNPISFAETSQFYLDRDGPNILEKENEAIWFINENVFKFSIDEEFISNRVKRSYQLEKFVPKILSYSKNIYHYKKEKGEVLSKVVNLRIFYKLLKVSEKFWGFNFSENIDKNEFNKVCNVFYKDKTYKRINDFLNDNKEIDEIKFVNGKKIQKIHSLLENVDWDYISEGIPVRFHGDFHFENIIYNSKRDSFVFLDWRQDFGGNLKFGDIYYDFAKLMHGLIINHSIIANELYYVKINKNEINYDFHRFNNLVVCENAFDEWITNNGYDLKKTKIITALIFLNIAPLHHEPYSKLLFSLGKDLLNKQISCN